MRLLRRGTERYAARREQVVTLDRSRDAALDAWIAATEQPMGNHPQNPDVMAAQHVALLDAGLLDFDEPTPWSHYKYQKALSGPFSPPERAEIRVRLGMDPFSGADMSSSESGGSPPESDG